MFKICARTVLELGSELISSDVIAFYELIKNAFDAKSPSGAEIRFEITLRRNDYLRFRRRATDGDELDQLKSEIEAKLYLSASLPSLRRVRQALRSSMNNAELEDVLDKIYADENRIIISDEGTGMSRQELLNNYLVIGTASRKRPVEAALARGSTGYEPPPYLGEKGIGRLSAMRLGDKLTVETAMRADKHFNVLTIDWTVFNNLDAMLDAIEIVPSTGALKPGENWCGTRLTISALTADWAHDHVRQFAEQEFAQLTDPFADPRERPRIAVFWNGTRMPVAHMDRGLLAHAHASVKASLSRTKEGLALVCRLQAVDLGFEHPSSAETRQIDLPDLVTSIVGLSGDIPRTALEQLGPLEFEAYWYNRRRIGGIDTVGDKRVVQDLQRRWSGILLFRDGFRVFPYGQEDDDWLSLDRRALGSTAYLLNKTQLVGRVRISRLGNPLLVDQTNREGLRACPEQRAFVGLLQLAIDQLRDFLRDIERRHKDKPLSMNVKTEVMNLVTRASRAIRQIRRQLPAESVIADELHDTFTEIRELFNSAHRRVSEVEKESRQMIQLAGVGLLVEVVAHELARSSENALAALNALRDKKMPQQIQGLLESLRSEMTAVSKRVRLLDPLSVSARQRKEVFDIHALIDDVLGGHEAQFTRHGIDLRVTKAEQALRIRAVKGMIVQIIENLVANSVYWLDVRSEEDIDFKPCISIGVNGDPLTITYEDNGTGIAEENREKVFRAFYSLKERSRRRGLGLYIARDCAEYHGGTLRLDDERDQHTGRLHRFLLNLPKEALIP